MVKLKIIILLILFVAFGSIANAVGQFHIDNSDTTYLPYTYLHKGSYTGEGKLHTIYNKLGLSLSKGLNNNRYIVARNPHDDSDERGQFSNYEFPQYQIIENQVPLYISDFKTYHDNFQDSLLVAGIGYDNDSAFVYKFNPYKSPYYEQIVFRTGKDTAAKGDGLWSPEMYIKLIYDYDFDGKNEMLVYFNGHKECSERILYCFELETLTIEWEIPMASAITDKNLVIPNQNPQDPRLFISTYNYSQGDRDSLFDDDYGYFVVVNDKGIVLERSVISVHYFGARMALSADGNYFYLLHEVDFWNPEEIPPSFDKDEYHVDSFYISKFSINGERIKTKTISMLPEYIFCLPFFQTGEEAIFVKSKGLINPITVFDTSLNQIAESDSVDLEMFLGLSQIDNQPVIVSTSAIYTYDFKKLLQFPGIFISFDSLTMDADSNVVNFILNSKNFCEIGAYKKKSTWDLFSLFFNRKKIYFMSILTGLIVVLFMVNYYRYKTKSNLKLIAVQKSELEKTHQSLKDAQAQIIEQEKYKQAKDIAGGFAHEIRNALYPVDIILTKLRLLENISNIDESKLRDYMKDIGSSIGKAVDLTELISQYTKLDSECMPEKVVLANLIKEVLRSNRLLIENFGVTIEFDCNSNFAVNGNYKQLSIVINNLLLNSIDALVGRDNPKIGIEIASTTKYTELQIIDNGIGIKPENINRIFDTFYSTKPDKGKGIGLSLSKKIIEMYDGEIDVKSNLNQGTTFILRLKRNNNEGKDINS